MSSPGIKHMNNIINTTKLDSFRKLRLDKINEIAKTGKFSNELPSMFVDQNAPLTTNRIMLNKVDYVVNEITEDNFDDVINALDAIGVVVSYTTTRSNAITLLSEIIDESIPECWGGEDVKEYVQIP